MAITTILFTDLVGSTALMQRTGDERARELVDAHREALAEAVAASNGTELQWLGDGLMAAFASPADAVRGAIAMQRFPKARGNPPELALRIGLAAGELLEQERRGTGSGYFGTPVVIARRLCDLAAGGQILCSSTVAGLLRGQAAFRFKELGAKALKGIAEPELVFEVDFEEAALRERITEDGTTTTVVRATPAPKSRRRTIWVGAAIAAFVAIVATVSSMQISRAPSVEVQNVAALPIDDRPAIAVLPFKNLSGNPDDDYFVDGLTEDLINRLGSWRQFPVIGNFSSAAYRHDSKSADQVAKELNARYLVQGSVRRTTGAVRINVGLYDSMSSVQIWNEHYDRPFDDVLALQDAISEAIVGAMYPELQGFDEKRAFRRNPADLTAWDMTQRGQWHFSRFTAADNATAIGYFEQAIARDPDSAFAEAQLTEAHYLNINFGWTDTPEYSTAQLTKSAERAVAVDPQNGDSQHALGHAYALTGNRDGMIQAFKTSLELAPNSSLGQVCAGEGLAMAGESDTAIEILNRAIRLSPKDNLGPFTYHAMALAYFAKENYDESVRFARRALSFNPQVAFFHRTLAAGLAHAGRVDEARDALARATELDPKFSLGGGRRIMLAGNPEMADRYMSGLRMAGLR